MTRNARLVAVLSIGVLTLAFLWPALATGTPWAFYDTASYYRGGAAAWAFLLEALGFVDIPEIRPGAEGAQSADGSAAGETDDALNSNVSYGIRSVPYSMVIYPLVRAAGAWGPVGAASLAMASLFWLTARDLATPARLLLGLGLAATTALPFYGALLQPDLLTAVVVLVPIAIMLHGERLGGWAVAGLMGAMAFATLAHYGNLPLAGFSMLWLGAWAALRSRRLVMALVGLPIVAAVVVNVIIGFVIDTGPSLAPGRHPLVLARSIDDGPGYDYLVEVCPEADWVLCDVYDEIPDNIRSFLWGPDRIELRATPEQLARIGAEELPLLLAIVRYDPLGQARAFLRNSAEQFFLFSSTAGVPARFEITPTSMETAFLGEIWAPSVPRRLQVLVLLLGGAAAAWAVVRRRHPEALAVSAFVLASLVVYAMIGGGLSAPVPRYQARLVWLVPMIGAILAFGRQRGPATPAPQQSRRSSV